jgi:TRAP-type C4-dicarboxylate transport system substrate-binding protein
MELKTRPKLMHIMLVCLVILTISTVMMIGCTKAEPTIQEPTEVEEPVTQTEEPVTIQFASFDPPNGFVSGAHQAWANELEKRTNGRYKVEFAWGASMGKMPEHYDLVQSGAADVAYFLPKMSPGLFPLSDVTELPWVLTDYETAIKAVWQLYKTGILDKEYSDVKILFMFTGAKTTQFSRMPINSLADMKGKKISGSTDEQVAALEGVKVVVGIPEVYSALDKGVVDVQWLPFPSVPSLNIQEVVKYAKTPVFGNPICVVAMNKSVYEQFPSDIQKIIDDLIEEVMLPLTIEGYNEAGAEGEKLFADAGGTVTEWSQADMAEMERRFPGVWSSWIDPREQKGVAAKQTIEEF